MSNKAKMLFSILFLATFLGSCSEDLDDVIRKTSQNDIKDFIWKGMNNIYLYKSDVPELSDERFSNQGELNDFLDNFNSPESLFYDALVAPQDEFSYLVDNYIELEKSMEGIGLSNGMQYGLVRLSSSSDLVVGYVRYVLPNTSASAQGVERGDLFNSIDGEILTMDNFARLLEIPSYTIGLAEIRGDEIISTGENISLNKQEYTSNPIFIQKVLQTEKGKVGYLMYNSFTRTFDPELNAAFAKFKAEAIGELILDLRYNGGGSVETAVDLASMITGQFEGELFAREQWNDDYQDFFEENDPEALENRFNSSIHTGELINSLNLSKVYILTSLRTASASELVINGLRPYIEVIQIGERTTGKFQASVTLYDSPDFGRIGADPGHHYAIQPLVYKSSNAAGVTDYFNGLQPDYEWEEDISDLGVLGDPSEPLLEAALNAIEGKIQKERRQSRHQFEVIGETGMHEILYQHMYSQETIPAL